MLKKVILVLIIVAAMAAAFVTGAITMANSTTTVRIKTNLLPAGEETVLEETVLEETILWENVEIEAWD